MNDSGVERPSVNDMTTEEFLEFAENAPSEELKSFIKDMTTDEFVDLFLPLKRSMTAQERARFIRVLSFEAYLELNTQHCSAHYRRLNGRNEREGRREIHARQAGG